ncbi:MAG: hypothetical protein H0V29_10260 [Thermoleophilaceae bacterium]|nr:hypothetical protein [Thermoleophilaceae bacterium]
MGRRSLLVLGACLAPLAGCGSDDEAGTGTLALTQPTPSVTTETPTRPETEPRPESTDTEAPEANPPAKTEPYRCGGEELKALSAPRDSKITVKPAIVEPGGRIEVRVKDASEARVSIAGVIDKPLVAVAKPDGGDAVATLTMPRSASCGNKPVIVAGDYSGQASVGVGTRP